MERIKTAFERENPEINVILNHIPGNMYDQKIKTWIASGNVPDVMHVNADTYSYLMTKDSLAAIDDIGNLDNSDFIPQFRDIFEKAGKTYGMTYFFNYFCLYYNKDLFDKKGIAYPGLNTGWDDIAKIAQALTVRDEKGILVSSGLTGGIFDTLVYEYGGDFFDKNYTKSLFNTEPVKKALLWNKKLVENGSIPAAKDYESLSSLDYFQMNKAAMMLGGTWSITDLSFKAKDFNWDIAAVPTISGKRTVQLWVNGFVIPAKSLNKKAAFKFIAYLCSEKAQKTMVKLQIGIPSRLSLWDFYITQNTVPENKSLVKDSLPFFRPRHMFAQFNEAQKIMNDYTKLYFEGRMTLDDTCKKVESEINKILH
ncbi:MAG: hypothetical protein A2096_08340 [Spirochaetes bacterium GWF1_41_5]|nr:MAG: hypothetical protein A2096_08340 [Spirochaetes bacterium GWF1_41_5]